MITPAWNQDHALLGHHPLTATLTPSPFWVGTCSGGCIRYKLIAERPSRPAGEALQNIIMDAAMPTGPDGSKEEPGLLQQATYSLFVPFAPVTQSHL